MASVLQFTQRPPSKFGFEKVRKKTKGTVPKGDQLNLFGAERAEVLKLRTDLGPFDEALLLDERNDPRAQKAYEQAIADGDSIADAYCNLGIIQSRHGKTARAFDSFTKSLEHSPRHFESHYNLGNLYFEEGDLKLARMHYEMGSAVDAEFPNLYFNLGLVLASLGDLRPAADAFKRYRKLAGTEEATKADNLIESIERSLKAQR